MTLFVQFSDSTETAIISQFASAQDAKVYPNQGTVETSDPVWKAYYDSFPWLLQQRLPGPTQA